MHPKSAKKRIVIRRKPNIFIKRWVDSSRKYGIGYMLSDNSVGVYFNDGSVLTCKD